jgi:hypothetical protein
VADDPSPKEIMVLAIVPSGSAEVAADAVMEPPTRIDPEGRVNAATGGLLMVIPSCLRKLLPVLSQPFTTSVCGPLATVIVPSRFAEFTE